MSNFKYTGFVRGRELVVEVDKVLRAAGVASILWDTCLLDIYGVPMLIPFDDFVIPDHQMDAAVQALKDAGFSDGDGKEFIGKCHWLEQKKEEVRDTAPWPAHWFHAHSAPWEPDNLTSEDDYYTMLRGRIHGDICLHRKSEVLWALPDPSLEDPAPDDPNYMLATDPRLPEGGIPGFGRGRYTVPGCRVQIPTPSGFTESLILNKVRDYEMVDRGFFWENYLIYMGQYAYQKAIDEDFLSPATLDPSLGKVWKAYMKSRLPKKEFNRRYFVPLRNDLIRKGVLPDTAVPWVKTHDEEIAEIYRRGAVRKAAR
ncbi:hypothetical protein BDW42DRAFT_185500 [Aspergillus taichungensis]|uniref:Uncharacterized protein n=1 Tax=Aspergillus taichungensis TaxID=482145 RepID=A0A2J5HVD0_9EURO|nr:hypothetical protein BDW42DRAFT_185500 [Aspergillus taichungensis]